MEQSAEILQYRTASPPPETITILSESLWRTHQVVACSLLGPCPLSFASVAFTSIDAAEQKGYEKVPPFKEAVAAHLCPPTFFNSPSPPLGCLALRWMNSLNYSVLHRSHCKQLPPQALQLGLPRGLVLINGSERCLFSYPDSPSSQTFLDVHVLRGGLPIYSPHILTVSGTTHHYSVHWGTLPSQLVGKTSQDSTRPSIWAATVSRMAVPFT